MLRLTTEQRWHSVVTNHPDEPRNNNERTRRITRDRARSAPLDLAGVKGQESAERALEIVAAGGDNLRWSSLLNRV